MDAFFITLKKLIVGTIFVMFALVATYVPHNWNKVEYADAAWATEVTQILNDIQLIFVNLATTASAAYDAITSYATDSIYVKEYVLDGIAWAVAKTIISNMIQSLVDWINSGFEGSPAFVQDLQGFLTNAADEAMGDYLTELTGTGSFLCSPFKLDIAVALALNYTKLRVDQPADTCTLTGVIDNIENFTSGVEGSFSNGGWNDWFDITSKPQVYTPYGSYLSAKIGGEAKLVNTKGEQLSLLKFGGGFLSGETCSSVSGPDGPEEQCLVSKPGKIIQEALTFNLDSGRQSLVTADEIDEVIAALLSQLVNKALTGAAGLLGLSSNGTAITADSTFTYTPPPTAATDPFMSLMTTTRDELKNYNTIASTWRPILLDYAADVNNPSDKRAEATAAAADALNIMNITATQVTNLNTWIADYGDPTTTDAERIAITNAYYAGSPYWTNADATASATAWSNIVNYVDPATTVVLP